MDTMLAEIQSLRQVLVQAYDKLIAEVTAEPGYDHLTVDLLTRERWRIAAGGRAAELRRGGGQVSDRVQPFANGTEYHAWTEVNCQKCALGYKDNIWGWPCAIEKAIDYARMEDGTVSREIADRMGFNDSTMFQLGWPCKEIQEVGP